MSSKPVIVSQDMTPVHLRANRSAFAMWFGRTILRVLGWRVEGEIPNLERILIIGAPHTSNWDFVYAMAAILALNIKLRWLGKHTIFKPGVTWFMEWLGGIPVNRSKPESIVDNVARLVEKDKGIVIGLAPEGTRKKVETWKTGFLRIAEAIDCKIFIIGLDFPGKRIVLDQLFEPTGDYDADIATLQAFYRRYEAKYPDQF
ncbi:1-acyl-sn-glycerol-3-phosphate acyltransferase [Porticoccaceae bacterium]|jgi:1-acyl-sn-glycerol-3-phosphate acyltransferase|nr:1-acyl-sn-glycerol-3-phosphate acyltransferase [Porticoccaceae bacterium]